MQVLTGRQQAAPQKSEPNPRLFLHLHQPSSARSMPTQPCSHLATCQALFRQPLTQGSTPVSCRPQRMPRSPRPLRLCLSPARRRRGQMQPCRVLPKQLPATIFQQQRFLLRPASLPKMPWPCHPHPAGGPGSQPCQCFGDLHIQEYRSPGGVRRVVMVMISQAEALDLVTAPEKLPLLFASGVSIGLNGVHCLFGLSAHSSMTARPGRQACSPFPWSRRLQGMQSSSVKLQATRPVFDLWLAACLPKAVG